MNLNFGDWAAIVGPVLGPFLIKWWSDRKESNKRLAEEQEAVEKRHEENQALLRQLVQDREDYPPHYHAEPSGPLTVEGIRMKPQRRIVG